ncbi:MAG: ferredoxin family protein [Planctomycetota bacterium]|nr:MAG: ferredoxin family protein [Planctomycetota bacterium]
MPFVIGEKCLGERYATCVEVCPVECIHPGQYQGQDFMIIDPEECIDCAVCKPECPVDAIFEDEEAPEEWIRINAELAPEFRNNPPVEPRPADDPPRREHAS